MLKDIVTMQFHDKSNHLRPGTFLCVSVAVRSSRLACFAAMLSLLYNPMEIKLK